MQLPGQIIIRQCTIGLIGLIKGMTKATEQAFNEADVVVKEQVYIPRIHVASIETCGCVASYEKAEGKLTVWMTTQAPHAIRTVIALVAGHVGLS